MPAGGDVGVLGVAEERRDGRRLRAEAPCFEQGAGLCNRRWHARTGPAAEEEAQGTRSRVAADLRQGGDRLRLRRALLGGGDRADEGKQRLDGARVLDEAECERRRGPHRRFRVGEGRDQQVHGRGIPNPPQSERGLAAHHRLGICQRLPEQGPVERARISSREDTGDFAHQRLVVPLGSGAATERQQAEQDEQRYVRPEPGRASGGAAREHHQECA